MKRNKIIQNSTTCGCCGVELKQQQCPNSECTLYSYTFKKVESIEIPEIDSILETVSEESKERISKQIEQIEIESVRKISEKERLKGRSENYYSMSAEEQWAEDKRLKILDWDGN